ncbi:hypothetical protein PLESTM_000754600 [Pleodorina starrii]|nr:hypothetical protein PLESTM_000754600 [Pleodorina starrii]
MFQANTKTLLVLRPRLLDPLQFRNLCQKSFVVAYKGVDKKSICVSALTRENNAIAQPRGERTAQMKRRGNEDPDVRISKEMSRLLRHKPPPGAMDSAGWVSLPVLLRHMRNHPNEEQVRRIVAACEKKRFVIDDSVNPPRIRAAQGHTVELAEAVLEPVTDADKVPVAVHVTSVSSWEVIRTSGELLRMKRTHIHFATEPHHMRKNKWAEVYLRLDLAVGPVPQSGRRD